MKKVSFIISNLNQGGAQRVVATLANAWIQNKTQVSIIILDSSQLRHYDLDPKINVVALSLALKTSSSLEALRSNIMRIIHLRSAINALSPDIIVSFVDRTNVITLFSTIGLKVPVIVSERTDPRYHKIGVGWGVLRRLIYRRAWGLVVQTKSVANWAQEILASKKIFVIENPLRDLPVQSECSTEKKILSVGRLSSEKGGKGLIEAFDKSKLVDQGWKLQFVGDGPMLDELKGLARKLKIQDSVFFVGRVLEPASYMKKADIFVLNSDYEGFPNALIEAMGMGMAVISSDCSSGPSDIITSGYNGLLFPVGDVNSLSEKMGILASSKEERLRLGKNASDVREVLRLDKVLAKWNSIVKKAVKEFE